MKLPRRRFLRLAAGAAALPVAPRIAWAQAYPSRPVRIIVPFPPGGFNDIVARIVATQLSERMGKQFIVDNRTGAGGVVGTEQVAHARNDGHTLLIASLALTINPWFHKVSYDSEKSFTPVAILATAPNVISVHPDLPVKTAADLIALARKQPGKLQYASSGVGSRCRAHRPASRALLV